MEVQQQDQFADNQEEPQNQQQPDVEFDEMISKLPVVDQLETKSMNLEILTDKKGNKTFEYKPRFRLWNPSASEHERKLFHESIGNSAICATCSYFGDSCGHDFTVVDGKAKCDCCARHGRECYVVVRYHIGCSQCKFGGFRCRDMHEIWYEFAGWREETHGTEYKTPQDHEFPAWARPLPVERIDGTLLEITGSMRPLLGSGKRRSKRNPRGYDTLYRPPWAYAYFEPRIWNDTTQRSAIIDYWMNLDKNMLIGVPGVDVNEFGEEDQ